MKSRIVMIVAAVLLALSAIAGTQKCQSGNSQGQNQDCNNQGQNADQQ